MTVVDLGSHGTTVPIDAQPRASTDRRAVLVSPIGKGRLAPAEVGSGFFAP
jgi:hypothetical protein